jgi:hypothetical protein
MSLSPQEAAAALHDIEQTERQSSILRGYQHGAPHLVMWGVLWAVGYGLTGLWPACAPYVWAAVVPIGIVGGFVIERLGNADRKSFALRRYVAISATLLAFFCAAFFVMAPVSGRQVGAFLPLFLAAAYVLIGIWRGLRYVAAGIAVAALTLAGFIYLGSYFPFWMAGVGGGALVLAGLWLRRV